MKTNIEEKLLHYMDEYNEALVKHLKLTEEYKELYDKTKIIIGVANEWKNRALKAEQALYNSIDLSSRQN